jgi:TPP-dependent 2-oxoacid decarboxylase
MKHLDNIGTTLVNTVINRGIFQGIININFAVFNFTPTDDGVIDLDPTIACRLRMDRSCALQLRDTLDDLLKQIEKMEANPTPETKLESGTKPKKRVEVN